jgi:hypothetical protein
MKCIFATLVLAFSVNSSLAQSTTFTYQGKLSTNSSPASGNFDMQFKLFDALTGGNQIGSTVDNPNTLVISGIFTVELDFVAGAFDGNPRFLEIWVRTTGNPAPYTMLSPRQAITSTPYAMRSANAAAADGLSAACVGCVADSHIEAVDGAKISGAIPIESVPTGSNNYIQNAATALRAGRPAVRQVGEIDITGFGKFGGDLVVDGKASFGFSGPLTNQLHVLSTTPGAPAIYAESENSRAVWGKSVGSRGIYGESSTGEGVYGISANASGVHGIATNASGAGGYFQNNAIGGTALLVDGSGNILFTGTGSVGIGTATPFAGVRLDVRGGSARVEPGNGGAISFGAPNAETGMLMQHVIGATRADVRFDGSTLKLVAGGPAGAPPSTNGIAINTAGSVGIGTTNPITRLHIEGSGGAIATTIKGLDERAILALDSNRGNVRRVWTLESGFDTPGYFGIFDQTAGRAGLIIDTAGTVKVNVLQIQGGGDFSENFDIAPVHGIKAGAVSTEIERGLVVSIDPANPGKLAVSRRAYDRSVAGIISGAGGIRPGLVMGQQGSIADGKQPVALTGRVWAYCDATQHPIKPGDLLTTSTTPGHAMRVINYRKAQGAIIGKAMTALKGGRGLVLVLVSLQ